MPDRASNGLDATQHQSGDKSRRTIVYVGAFELPDRNAAAQRVLANAFLLRMLGYRVVLAGVTQETGATDEFRRMEPDPHLPFECWERSVPDATLSWFKRVVGIGPLVRLIDTNCGEDLLAVICYDFPAISQLRLRSFLHRKGAKALAEVTEWYSPTRGRSLAAIARNMDSFLRMRLVNPMMDGLVVASRYLADHYRRADLPILELPTLVSDDVIAAPPHPATEDGQPKRLFFAGTGFDPAMARESKLGLKDRLDWVIRGLWRAHREGAEFQLDIFGVTHAAYCEIYPEDSDILAELAHRIVFHGRQPREIVRAALSASDYSIFLRAETRATLAGFPTKFGESIHFGTPVITNAIGSIQSHHTEGATGHYVECGDEAVLGRQLRNILGTPSQKVAAMKELCQRSGMFHYRHHLGAATLFNAEMEAVDVR